MKSMHTGLSINSILLKIFWGDFIDIVNELQDRKKVINKKCS